MGLNFTTRFLSIVSPSLMLSGCLYMATPIEAWVVNESGQPIEGVTVVAHWQQKGGLEGGNDVGQLMVMEAVTDKKGRFAFSGWGPKLAFRGSIKADRPQLLLFKSEYQPLALANEVRSDYGKNPILTSDWNGKSIKMRKADGALQDQIQDFVLFNIKLEVIIRDAEACEWKKIPSMLRAIRRQRLALTSHGKVPGAWKIESVDESLIANAEYFSQKGGVACGSPKNIFNLN